MDLLSLRPSWSTENIPVQPRLHKETPSKTKQKYYVYWCVSVCTCACTDYGWSTGAGVRLSHGIEVLRLLTGMLGTQLGSPGVRSSVLFVCCLFFVSLR